MSTAEQLYTPEWQQWHKWTNDYSTRALYAAFAHLGVPRRLLDLGCADGHLVKVAAALGVEAVGMDIAVEPDIGERFELRKADLSEYQEIEPYRSFDMVLSWEVAEHLPEANAGGLVSSIVRNIAPGGWLVFTAAVPGQGGHGHINEQPHSYWRERFAERGLTYLSGPTEALRSTWAAVTGPCWWYPQNLQVFGA